jgi:ribonucleotide monophosphatase NagD (HAD superfamily)
LLIGVELASGRQAEVMGKPNRPMMEAIKRRLGARRQIAIIGDQPGTDLAGGRSMGWATILVLSGVSDPVTADNLEPPPDLILPSLVGLLDVVRPR